MLKRHVLMNMAGLGLPLIVAIFTIPILISHLGEERFGVLTLIWAVVSYFGLFDMGLGRALTLRLSEAIALGKTKILGPLVWTSLILMLFLGVLSGCLIYFGSSWLVSLIEGVTDRDDVVGALIAIAWAMPFVIVNAGLKGVLEAKLAFGIINLIRIPMGVFTFVGPLMVVLLFGNNLTYIAWVLCAGRIVFCFIHGWYAFEGFQVGRQIVFERSLVKPLLSSGGWMSVSNVVSPFMGYVDRFVIATTISASMVTYYTTPYEMITKIWIIPGAVTSVLFPHFAQKISCSGSDTWILFKKSISAIFLITFPVVLTLFLFSEETMTIWISKDFSQNSSVLLQIFAIGILVNCMAHVPFTLIQSANKARITATIHCIILPLYLLVLWFGTIYFGLIGAAMSWLIRIVVDAFLMFYFGTRVIGYSISDMWSIVSATKIFILALLSLGIMFDQLNVRIMLLIIGVAYSVFYGLKLFKH